MRALIPLSEMYYETLTPNETFLKRKCYRLGWRWEETHSSCPMVDSDPPHGQINRAIPLAGDRQGRAMGTEAENQRLEAKGQ